MNKLLAPKTTHILLFEGYQIEEILPLRGG
jgi:hypothetical protein